MNNLYANAEAPAVSPSFAAVAAGVDRSSGERWLSTCFLIKSMKAVTE